jgi:hypothetical protein
MEKHEQIRNLRNRVTQMYLLSSRDIIPDHVNEIAGLYNEIQGIFIDLLEGKEPETTETKGKTLVEVFTEEERKQDASKIGETTEVHGDVRPLPR